MKKLWLLPVLVIVVIGILLVYTFTRPDGYVRLETPGVQGSMSLHGNWSRGITLTSEAEPQTVRSGTYQPRQIDLLAKQGVDWYRLYSSGPWGQLGEVEIKPEETTVLQPGPPLTLKADVNRRGRNVSIGFTIVGRAGEEYETVVKNGKRTPTPTVKIVDSEGKTLASGKFEYG
ncbi:MAG: hypothetical protein BWY71_01128 [Planctomycetes bacterium ADurb.Bin412]|nr:MAG: hypothetical protein BWY71_01128 [Planctomycetes bacterium ADurb.Bin412]